MQQYATADIEPSLSELLGDPIMDLVLARDGVSRNELDALIAVVQRTLKTSRLRRGESRTASLTGLAGLA